MVATSFQTRKKKGNEVYMGPTHSLRSVVQNIKVPGHFITSQFLGKGKGHLNFTPEAFSGDIRRDHQNSILEKPSVAVLSDREN